MYATIILVVSWPLNTNVMGKPMLRVGLLAWATSCGGLGCAVAADKIEVPGVDNYVEESVILLSRTYEYIITIKTWDESRSARSRPQTRGINRTKPRRTPSESTQN